MIYSRMVEHCKPVPLPPCRQEAERYSSYFFLTSTLDGVSGQRHVSATFYHRWNDPWYPLATGLDGSQSRYGHMLEEKSLAFAGKQTPVAQSVVRHYTEWALPALIQGRQT
jgi:hypothetical protein